MSDLYFDGSVGDYPPTDSVEWKVLAACADVGAWKPVLVLAREDFETAINKLRDLGWGFQWVTLH